VTAKVLSQAGISISDQYDFQGSSEGVREMEIEVVQAVHDLGPTMTSERMLGRIDRTITPVGLLQSVEIDMPLGALPEPISKVYGIQVFANNAGRTTNLAVHVANARGTIQEFPVWVWDETGETATEIVMAGGATGSLTLLTPIGGIVIPQFLLVGAGQQLEVSTMVLRGNTSAFGAGTIFYTVLVYLAFPGVEGGAISTFGSSLPSW